uniref:C2H2-type domain-containing protein n=1 Tax=Aquila chrysaetos chrysaetos TaxID=223781 RepID=A0A663FED2_AQUCH
MRGISGPCLAVSHPASSSLLLPSQHTSLMKPPLSQQISASQPRPLPALSPRAAMDGSCTGRTAACQRNSTREKFYSCPVCRKNFLLKINLIIHQRSHSNWGFCQSLEPRRPSRDHGTVWGKPSPKRYPLSPGKMMYTCNECMERFSSQSFLILHQRQHTSHQLILCPCCNRSFAWVSEFVRYHRSHTGERPYQCGVCQKTFKRHNHLIVHQRIHMRQGRPYPCGDQLPVPPAHI